MELFSESSTGREADLYRPLMAYLRDKNRPYIPRWELLPLHKQCKLALLWKEAGFLEDAGRLAAWLLKLEEFSTLWCPEKEFSEDLSARLFAKLREIEPIFGGGFDCNLTLHQAGIFSAALTWDGIGTSLGMIKAGIEVRSFGPQAENRPFGIAGKGMNGWARMAAYPEVWIEMKVSENGLDFRFVGVKPEQPISLALYIKAQSCEVGKGILQPKSLKRYQGETDQVRFEKKYTIVAEPLQKVRVIPLAGDGSYWGADFMLSYTINPFTPQLSLNFY